MSRSRNHSAILRSSVSVAVFVALIVPASATPFELIYTGTFSSADSLNPTGAAIDTFPDSTPFVAKAFFDDSSPNLVSKLPIHGFVAYSPTLATLTIGRDTFTFATYDQDPMHGVSIAISDSTTEFGPLGHYEVGFLQNPVAYPVVGSAGFIGDFASVAPIFTAANLTPTTFIGYTRVRYGSGPETSRGSGVHTIVPIPLTDTHGNTYSLTLGNYDEQAASGVQNTANILAVPVPETSSTISLGLLLALGLGGAVLARKKVRTETL